MLAVMALRHTASGLRIDAPRAGERLLVVAALLGLLWNTGALLIYAFHDFGIGQAPPLLTVIAFAALGFLPAVAVHSAVSSGISGRLRPLLITAAYTLSGIAGVLQSVNLLRGGSPSRAALLVLTGGFVALVMLFIAARGRQPGWQRHVSVVALAAFAASALHLSHPLDRPDSWWIGLVGHHSSLPLVLAILYHDFRFAFADLFLRRALSLLILVGLALSLHVLFATPLMETMQAQGQETLLATAAHIALWVGTALCYPLIRRGVGWFVDRVVLERTDFRHVRDDMSFALSRIDSTEGVLTQTCAAMAAAIGARHVDWHPDIGRSPAPHASIVGAGTRVPAVVLVPTSDRPCYAITIDGMTGGRRLMSDDILLLESLATIAGRRIDALRVTQERFARDLREREITQLAAEAELRALRAQLSPHFLFNALNTIGYLIEEAPKRATGTLYRLTELLRAVLQRPTDELVTIGNELSIIEAYIDIERARFEGRLVVAIDVPAEVRVLGIPPLLIQPLVENAVKHGISPLVQGGVVEIAGTLDRLKDSARVRLTVSDTGAGFDPSVRALSGTGVGLSSVEARLNRQFGPAASLSVTSQPGSGTTVTVTLPAVAAGSSRPRRASNGPRSRHTGLPDEAVHTEAR
jgi:signal transduction histidine kinase